MPKTRLQYDISRLFERINLQKLAEDLSPYLDIPTPVTIDSLDDIGPSQTGNNGKFLTTDGTNASWATLAGGGDMLQSTYDPGAIADDAFDYNNFTNTPSIPTQYTDELAQDAVGTILTDTATIDFTYTDATPTIEASVKSASITEAMQVLADNTTQDVSTSKHGYVPKAPNSTTQFLRGDATWASAPDSWTTVMKPTTQTKSSDNVYADDTALSFSTTANTDYWIELNFLAHAGNATADFKWQFNHTGTTTLCRYYGIMYEWSSVTSFSNPPIVGTSIPTSHPLTAAGGLYKNVQVTAFLEVGASGGTFSLQWAQNTSTAVNTNVYAYSYIRYRII